MGTVAWEIEAKTGDTTESLSKVVDKEVLAEKTVSLEGFSPNPPNVREDENVSDEELNGPEFDVSVVTRTNIPDCDAFYLDNVLTPDECELLKARTEDAGYGYWDSQSKKPAHDFRSAFTLEVQHERLANLIWERTKHLVDPKVTIEEDDERSEIDIIGTWKPSSVNPTKLFSRYKDGGHFAVHSDGCSIRCLNERTFYTALVYLNEPLDGGETKLYKDCQRDAEWIKDEKGRLRGNPENCLFACKAIPGRVLVFYHRMLHEGCPADEKYIIRTDYFYKRTPAICTEPKDLEAFDLYQHAQLLAEKGHCMEAAKAFDKAFRMSRNLSRLYKMGG